MSSANKDLQTWLEAAEKQGWRVDLSNGKHIKFLPPEGGEDSRPVIASRGTLSGRGRKMKNLKANLKRRGLEI